MTPDSLISRYKSLPSLERSPTPANTENPPCAFAILCISSIITTVLPTPAPPNAPTFPPFKNGHIKSIGFMPVSRISVRVLCSNNPGAALCIGSLSSVATGPFWSIGSPVTLNIRPRVAPPTGTFIGDCVSTTLSPLLNPSVEVIATVLTTPSPSCCCTSNTILPSAPVVSALYIAGIESLGNWTSTTAPITCFIVPELIFSSSLNCVVVCLGGGG